VRVLSKSKEQQVLGIMRRAASTIVIWGRRTVTPDAADDPDIIRDDCGTSVKIGWSACRVAQR
jgi:hypothetical protein